MATVLVIFLITGTKYLTRRKHELVFSSKVHCGRNLRWQELKRPGQRVTSYPQLRNIVVQVSSQFLFTQFTSDPR